MFNPDQILVTLLQATVAAGASDLHLSVGRPPTARRDGILVPFEGVSVLAPHDTERIVFSLAPTWQLISQSTIPATGFLLDSDCAKFTSLKNSPR